MLIGIELDVVRCNEETDSSVFMCFQGRQTDAVWG